jgi:hypothetical protein
MKIPWFVHGKVLGRIKHDETTTGTVPDTATVSITIIIGVVVA